MVGWRSRSRIRTMASSGSEVSETIRIVSSVGVVHCCAAKCQDDPYRLYQTETEGTPMVAHPRGAIDRQRLGAARAADPRRRQARTHEAILDATMELLAERGYFGLT